MPNNPIIIPIPPNAGGAITCMSYADTLQKVTLQAAGQVAVFTGKGQGVPMKTDINNVPTTVLPLPPSPIPYQITALFQFAEGEEFINNTIVNNPTHQSNGIILETIVVSVDGAGFDPDGYVTLTIATEEAAG